jgi:hypothetical protein
LLLVQKPYNDTAQSRQLISLSLPGGAPTVLADYTYRAYLYDANADYVYLYIDRTGFFRQPVAGGSAELLSTQTTPRYLWADPDRFVIFDYGQVKPGATLTDNFAYGVFTLPAAGGTPSLVTCLDISGTAHANAKHGKNLYLSTYESSVGKNAIFHITLP